MPLSDEPTVVPPRAKVVRVHPVDTLAGTVRLPGSKSITNRALLMAGLADGRTVVRNVLDCDDSRHMLEALERLGVGIRRAGDEVTIAGVGGPFPVHQGEFFIGNAGTTARFLTAALAATGGKYAIDGDPRMRLRPIGPLVQTLRDLGADVDAPSGCPPVRIGARALEGGRASIPGNVSSQFISAVLLAAPLAPRKVELTVTGELISRPYIDLTIQGMRAFGASVWSGCEGYDAHPKFVVSGGRGYQAREEYVVEGDASAASYFYGAAAVTGGTVRVEGVGKESLQGDALCADVLAAMGCRVKKERGAMTVTGPRLPSGILAGVDHDCGEIPDVVPTLAVVALFARGRTRLRGVPHLRHKESDRIASVASELRKLGGRVKELPDGLQIEGTLGPKPAALHGAKLDSWGDHRIAMAMSLAALCVPDVVIDKPQVVSKSFPEYFGALRSLGVEVEFE